VIVVVVVVVVMIVVVENLAGGREDPSSFEFRTRTSVSHKKKFLTRRDTPRRPHAHVTHTCADGDPHSPDGGASSGKSASASCIVGEEERRLAVRPLAAGAGLDLDLSELTALGPLDGRYASKTASLRPYFSESVLTTDY